MCSVASTPARQAAGVLIVLLGALSACPMARGQSKNRSPINPLAQSADGKRASSYHEEEIRFANGDVNLAGVLCIPKARGPYPVVVFVHGSGSLDRKHWTLHPPLREHLAQHGIASLCWDKPGVGASGGDWTLQSFQDRALEALAAVQFLRGRRDIDRRHIGLWGISQGGWICPLAASLSPDVAFLILVSSPVGSIAEQDIFRVEQGMRADGMPERDIDKARAFVRRRIEIIRHGSFQSLDAAQHEVAGQQWFTDYVHRLGPKDFAFAAKNIAYDGRHALHQVRCPVLIIVGERDTVVPSKESARVIKEILTQAGNSDVTLKVFPQADHFLHQARTGGPREMRSSKQAETLVSGYFSAVSEWLRKTLAGTKSAVNSAPKR